MKSRRNRRSCSNSTSRASSSRSATSCCRMPKIPSAVSTEGHVSASLASGGVGALRGGFAMSFELRCSSGVMRAAVVSRQNTRSAAKVSPQNASRHVEAASLDLSVVCIAGPSRGVLEGATRRTIDPGQSRQTAKRICRTPSRHDGVPRHQVFAAPKNEQDRKRFSRSLMAAELESRLTVRP